MNLWTWVRARASIRLSSRKSRRNPAGPASRPLLEQLEDRTAPAVTLIYGGANSVLSLTESASGATPSITISEVAANMLQINLNGNTFAAGSTAAASGLTYSIAGNPTASSSATVNITSANQISTLLATLPGDFVSLGPIADTNGGLGNLNISANFIFVPASDTINTSNASAANGNIVLSAATTVQVNAGSMLLANNGSITLKGNAGGTPANGNFVGVNISGATVETTGAGNILLEGTGGSDPTTGGHIGVLVSNSGATAATVEATGTGSVTLDGTGGPGGGPGGGRNFGVDISGTNSGGGTQTVVKAATGLVAIAGQGGASTTATSFDVGVQIVNNALVTTTNGGNIAITGTGGPGTAADFGVDIAGANTLVSSSGSVQITGTGGGGSSANTEIGVDIDHGAQVTATGAATITGTGGQGTGSDFGVILDGSGGGSLVQSAAAIQITGTGGGTGAATSEFGVLLNNGAKVTATGDDSITITGTAGQGTSNELGVNITDSGTAVTSQGGNVLITGSYPLGSGTSIQVANSAAVSTSGAGTLTLNGAQDVAIVGGASLTTADGALTVLANQGPTPAAGTFVGINLVGATVTTTGQGAIVLDGRGGNNNSTGGNSGTAIQGGAQVLSAGTGTVTVTGVGGTGANQNFGVFVAGGGSVISSVSGAIRVTGTGGNGSAELNAGVVLNAGGRIASKGTGPTAATITVTGTGGTGTTSNVSSNYGVVLQGTDNNNNPAEITSVDGAIRVTGTGGSGTGDFDLGVAVFGGGLIQATGIAPIVVAGTGGTGGQENYGVVVWDTGGGAQVQSATGAISVTGQGGTGTGGANFGVTVQLGGRVTATGAAAITLTGAGGNGTGGDNGVNVDGGQVTSQGGAVQLSGSANVPGSTSVNIVNAGAVVSTTGAGTLTVTASQDVVLANGAAVSTADGALAILANQGPTPAAGDFSGINVIGGSVQTTGAGDLLLQGRGGNDPGTSLHVGVLLQGGTLVQATGTGSVSVTGTGGQGGANNAGVGVEGSTTQVTAAAGNVTVTGVAGNGTSNVNAGINIATGATVSAAGSGPGTGLVTLAGTGGTGTDNNVGVGIQSASTLVTAANALTITGTGGSGSTIFNRGVAVITGAVVRVTGGGPLTITGTGGTGTGSDFGVDITGTNTAVAATAGPIAITGTAGAGAGSTGLELASAGAINGNLNTPITLTADSMTFDATAAVANPGNIVTLQPLTPGTQINLGGANAPGVLGLSAAALMSDFHTSALHVGNATAGTVTVSAVITPNQTPTLALITGAGITTTGPGALDVANLRTSSAGPVSLTGANVVGTLAAQVTGSGAFAFNDTNNGLVVGTVESVPGITTTGGNVALTLAGMLNIGTGAGEGITAPGGTVDLNAPGVVENSPSVITAAGLRLQGTGTFTLTDANAVTTLAGNFTGPLTYSSPGTLTIGPLLGTPGLASGNGNVTLTVTAGGLIVNGPVQAGTGTVDVAFTGALTAIGGAPVAAAALAVRGGTGVGSAAAPLTTGLGLLAVNVDGGGVFIANAGNLVIGTVHALSGVTATGGAITIGSTANLTVNQPVTTATAAGDAVMLSGNGTIGLFAPLTGNSAAVQDGPGNDTITVQTTLPTALSVGGGAGSNTLNFDASNQPIYTAPGRYVLPGQQPLTYGSFSSIFLDDAGSVSTFYGPDTADRSTALAGLTPQERFVQGLYLDALGRAGSKAELDGWVPALSGPGGPALVAGDIERSAEARDHLVKTWYLTYLGRPAQNGEEQGWVNALLAGQTEETVLSGLLSTQEFFNRAPTITGDGGLPSNQEYVKALYIVLLNRTASASEVSMWVNGLPTLGRAGVAQAIMTSVEGSTDRIEAVYNALLHRPADGGGLNGWLMAVLDATSVRVGIESSLEFFFNG